jgi:hypothetical protein
MVEAEIALNAIDAADVLTQVSYQGGDFGLVTDALTRPEVWIGAALGGAFGAAIGALPAFIFTGFFVFVGGLAGPNGPAGGVGIGFGAANIPGPEGFGLLPVFGPHISFAGGAAAAAYAAKQGYMQSGFDYHNGKDIGFALGSKPDILAVGAVFGLLAVPIEETFRLMAVPTDPIAITVVISALLHRVAFGYSVIGNVSSKANGFFDMGPFEREEMRDAGVAPGDGDKQGEDRLAVEPWLPNMYKWGHVAAIGAVAGGLGGVLAYMSGSVFLGFGLSATSLFFLNLGVERIPVTHHMTLPGATAYVATQQTGGAALAGQSVAVGLIVGAIFGLLGAVIGEAFQRVFYAHGDTHVDPPAASIFIVHALIAVLSIAGVFATSVWVPGAV